MSLATILMVIVAVALFAGFAGALAWAQQHARPIGAVTAEVRRQKRRPF